MNFFNSVATIYLISLTGFARAENPDETTSIRHDPFQRPVLFSNSAHLNVIQQPTEAAESNWTPTLTMILRAGRNSMVNVDGQIVKLGERIRGYTLIKVHERSAIFSKQGQTVLLNLDDDHDQ